MSKLTLALMFSAYAAFATAAPSTVTITASTAGAAATSVDMVQVEVVRRAYYPINSEEFMYLGGSYTLDNGATLRVSKSQNRYYAEIDGVIKSEVSPVAQNVFVAKDDSIRMVFQPNAFSTDVTVRYTVSK